MLYLLTVMPCVSSFQGVQFIDEKDLKDFSNWKMDKGCLSLITMFRHCGRIREIRGGGITRFAVC